MNTIFFRRTAFLLSLATVTVVSSGLKAQAQTTDFTAANVKTEQTLDTTAPMSSSAPMPESSASQIPEITSKTTDTVVAQARGTTPPLRATRSGPSYIGVGSNIGFRGDTRLSQGSANVFSKVGLTNTLSARPSALVGSNAAFLLPVTVDFAPRQTLGLRAAPYVGGGVAISTARDSTIGPLLTGGVDVPVSRRVTATAGVNVGFIDRTDVGLLLGVGYNY
ncbi:MAG TPA: hypothetical protein V6D35_07270 [Candidatus Sericytochromatia bacterium]